MLTRVHKFFFITSLALLIPIWNIPHTITGRYICEAILLITVSLYKPQWSLFFQKNKVLLIFFAYLIAQLIFFSHNFTIAFSNFRAEWMHFILFSLIGSGVGLILGRENSKSTLLYFGIAFSFPLYIHLILSLIRGIAIGSIPWSYWGINEIHGDLGYTALQAIIFLIGSFLYEAKTKTQRIITIALALVCVASPLLAESRGGVGFTLFAIIFMLATHTLMKSRLRLFSLKNILGFCCISLIVLGVYKIGITTQPERWGGTFSRLLLGFQGNPTDVYCQGIGSLESELQSKGQQITPSIQKGLNSIVDGDGGRVMAMRSGISLIPSHLMGINQSKQAYQQAISQQCNGTPKIFISHTHNAWVDTSLAIGLPGTILLILALMQYARSGYQALRINADSISAYGATLFTNASVWLLRGGLDSTMRDQMMEMQAFTMAMLLGLIIAKQILVVDVAK